jgi:DNA-binding NarL/FixJ family response regulator
MHTILIYEDNDELRESVCCLLRLTADYRIAGAFAGCGAVEEQIKELAPDVILMDIDMPGITGIEAVKRIRTFDKKVPVIMLTIFDDNEHVFKAIYNGADGYLLKKHISDKLTDAIKDVLQGGAPMSPAIARMVIGEMQQKNANDYGLTSREKDILALLSQGYSFKMIAHQLDLSIDTIKTHSKHIYDKLHVNSQIEAVSKALNERLV